MMRLLLTVLALLGALSASGEGYVLNGPKWTSPASIAYYVNTNSRWLTPAQVLTAVTSMADVWNALPNNAVRLVYAGTTTGEATLNNGKNEIFFKNAASGALSADTIRWWDGAQRLTDVDIVIFEAQYQFIVQGMEPCSLKLYLENTLIHEFGHFLGLSHSTVPSATMTATAHYCDLSLTSLDPDDIAGIGALYPANPLPPPPSPSGPTLTVRAYKVKGARHAELTWSGLAATSVDVRRGGSTIATVANGGAYTDPVGGKGGGSWAYAVCAAGTTTCTNTATAVW